MSLFSKDKKAKEESRNNPYLDGRREWLERYGSYISSRAQWRAIAFICLIITSISVFGNIMQAMQVKTIPYLVEVDKLGRSSLVKRLNDFKEAPVRLIQAEIAACIVNWRTVTVDIELQKQMIQQLTYFVAGSAKGVLREYYMQNNPYEIAKQKKLIQVTVDSLPLPISRNSYRVEWTETTRSHTGVTLNKVSYQATVTIQIEPPTSEAVLLHNPGGVYITSLSASRILTADEPDSAQRKLNSN